MGPRFERLVIFADTTEWRRKKREGNKIKWTHVLLSVKIWGAIVRMKREGNKIKWTHVLLSVKIWGAIVRESE